MGLRRTATADHPAASGHPDPGPVRQDGDGGVQAPRRPGVFEPSTLGSRRAARETFDADLPKPPDEQWFPLGEQEFNYPAQGGSPPTVRRCHAFLSWPTGTHMLCRWDNGVEERVRVRGSGMSESARPLGVIPDTSARKLIDRCGLAAQLPPPPHPTGPPRYTDAPRH